MKKFSAFTLAEVLITLAIIGVVAAMTVPTLMQNHQRKLIQPNFIKCILCYLRLLCNI